MTICVDGNKKQRRFLHIYAFRSVLVNAKFAAAFLLKICYYNKQRHVNPF